jgi:hypothetical protein
MAKGFGVEQDKQLGYVLVLMPEVNAYAAKFSLDFKGEAGPFIGITNMLNDAQVWKSLKQAKQAIEIYTDFLIQQQLESGTDVEVRIKSLKRSGAGELKVENVETLRFLPEMFQK